jgi:hypothetical protein
MDSSLLRTSVLRTPAGRKPSTLLLAGLLALTVCAGNMQATLLSASAAATTALTAPNVVCNTLTGVPLVGQTFTVHAFPAPTGVNTITVGVVQTAGLKVTPPLAVILSAATNGAGLIFTVNSTAGCAGTVSGANIIPVQLTAASNAGVPGNDVTVAVTDTVTALTTALVAAPVTITCGYSAVGPVNIPSAPQPVSVTSAANLGTPFTVTTGTVPSWLVLGPTAPAGTAGANAAIFTVSASVGCGAFAGVQKTYSVVLVNAPAPSQTVLITLNAATVSPLIVTPVPNTPTISISFVKSSGNPGIANVNVTSPTLLNAYFIVNTGTLPIWLTVDTTAATVPAGGKAIRFSTTTETDSLAPGNYTATVFLQVSGYGDTPIVITLLVTNKPPKLSVTSANPMAVPYTLGGPAPVTTITLVSSDSPIPYSITFGGALAPQLAAGEQLTGIAYSFGSGITIVYNSLLFSTSAPGTILTGTVTFTWGSPASVLVVTLNLTVGSPGATITSISPATLPTAPPGTVFHVTVLGSGFVGGSDPSLATKVGLVTGSNPATLNLDTNFVVTYNSPANLDLKITVPVNPDASLPFAVAGAGGLVFLGVANGSSTIPTGTQTLTIGAGPIIYGVTSSSSFNEVSGGNLPTIAPYDMVSIFGSSFCSSVGTGCTSTQILAANPDPVTVRFPFSLSPDVQPAAPALDTRRQLSVTFYVHGVTTGGLPAPLLFATNGQINTIVPGAVVVTAGASYDIVVSFGCPLCTPSTVVSSVPFPVYTVPVDPGIFTIGSDGQGAAAALASGTYALIDSASPAGMRYTAPESDTIQIYMTGLGVPGVGAAFASNNGACINALTTGYLAALAANTAAAASFTTIDGDVLQTSLYPGDKPPCLTTEPTVTIGGVATPAVGYAAFVGDTVAGLYQINVQLPATQNTLYPNFPSHTGALTNLTGPTQLPVFVTLGGLTSQAGVMLSVAPRLVVTPPAYSSGTTINLSIGHAYSDTITGSNNGSHAGVTYAVTSGVLPQGLTLVTAAGVETIAGTPAEDTNGSYPVTITATDSSAIPVTGSASFTYYVPGGLFVTEAGLALSTFGTPNPAIATVTAVGGTAPYSQFAITTPMTPITGMSITTGGILQTDGTTPAGTYTITVTATDAAGVTGTVAFTFIVKLLVVFSPVSPQTASIGTVTNGGLLNTLTVSGGVGPYTYSVDASSTAAAAVAGALNLVGNLLNLGTDVTVSTQDVVIDVIDTGAPVSSAAVDTLTGTAGSEFTLVLNLTL